MSRLSACEKGVKYFCDTYEGIQYMDKRESHDPIADVHVGLEVDLLICYTSFT